MDILFVIFAVLVFLLVIWAIAVVYVHSKYEKEEHSKNEGMLSNLGNATVVFRMLARGEDPFAK